MTDPRDITVDHYVGKTFQRTAPAEFTDCSNGGSARFKSWENDLPDGDLGWSFYEPDEVETLRVLDVDCTIIIANEAEAGPSSLSPSRARRRAQLDQHRAGLSPTTPHRPRRTPADQSSARQLRTSLTAR